MSLRQDIDGVMSESFPRVSGDEPPRVRVVIPLTSFSPRERG